MKNTVLFFKKLEIMTYKSRYQKSSHLEIICKGSLANSRCLSFSTTSFYDHLKRQSKVSMDWNR